MSSILRPRALVQQLRLPAKPGAQRWFAPAGHAALATALALLLLLVPPAPALAAIPVAYRCDGEPLLALADNGAVDAIGIPNTAAGTVPGAFVVLQWRGVTLQLPRTNNAGAPSYTDGKWWWSLEDPAAPRFQLRQGGVTSYACERAA
ncbi:hypothetical protein [Synechococcus sp. ATX 2A4]|uniref:hypothetical protein n=1 Tax=Synechococcus sp. ATX 2A4 TaxID=2823727 RepID=UPI0028F43D91|nr:hypothetical protein [Synechococcus sp. ATX 2A4]